MRESSIFAPLLQKSNKNAGVVKLVDTPDLGSGAARLGGSSPSTRTFFFELLLTTRFDFRAVKALFFTLFSTSAMVGGEETAKVERIEYFCMFMPLGSRKI